MFPQRPDRAYVGYIDGGVVILDMAGTRAVLESGRITLGGPAAELLGSEAVQRAYLGA